MYVNEIKPILWVLIYSIQVTEQINTHFIQRIIKNRSVLFQIDRSLMEKFKSIEIWNRKYIYI